MAYFRALTEQEEVRQNLILTSVASSSAMQQLKPNEAEISMALAKTIKIMTDVESPFPGHEPLKTNDFNATGKHHYQAKSAVGHAMTMQANNEFDEPNDIVTSMLSDIHSQAAAAMLINGIENPEVAKTLSPSQQRVVEYALEDTDVRMDIAKNADGEYHLLNDDFQNDLRREMNGSELPRSVRNTVSQYHDIENYREDHAHYTAEDIQNGFGSDGAIGDALREKHINSVVDLITKGKTTGAPENDRAIKTVYNQESKDQAVADPEWQSEQMIRIVIAGARLTHMQNQKGYIDPKAGVAIMLNQIGIMEKAEYQTKNEADKQPNIAQTQKIASGAWHNLNNDHAEAVAKSMSDMQHAPSGKVVEAQSTIIKENADQQAKLERRIQAARMQQASMGM